MHAYLRSFIRSLMSIACIHMQIFYEHWARPIHPDWAVKHRLIAICLHYHLIVATWHRNCWLCLWEPRCFWQTKMSFWKKEAAVCQGVTLSTLTFPLLLFEFFPAFWRIQTHGESVKAVQKLRCSLTAYSPHPPVIERSAHVMFVFQGNHWSILVHEFLGTQIFQDLGSWRLLKDINLWDLKERRGIAVCKTPGTGKAVVAFRQFHLDLSNFAMFDMETIQIRVAHVFAKSVQKMFKNRVDWKITIHLHYHVSMDWFEGKSTGNQGQFTPNLIRVPVSIFR